MHELSIMENIRNIVLDFAEKNNAIKVRKVNLTIGELSDIIPRWAQIYFSFAAKDTIAEEAELCIEKIPAVIKCTSCGEVLKLDKSDLKFNCIKCGSSKIALLTGREFRIRSIEVDTDDSEVSPDLIKQRASSE